jgi:hypothetical protein
MRPVSAGPLGEFSFWNRGHVLAQSQVPGDHLDCDVQVVELPTLPVSLEHKFLDAMRLDREDVAMGRHTTTPRNIAKGHNTS